MADFRSGHPDHPVHVFFSGFGLMTDKSDKGTSKLEDDQIQEAKEAEALWVQATIPEIPPGWDDKHTSGLPSIGVDARLIKKAMEKAGVDLSGPVAATGHSEGTAIAIAFMEEVNQDHRRIYKNDVAPPKTLRLCSLLGSVGVGKSPTGLNLPGAFTREVLNITMEDLVGRLRKVTGKELTWTQRREINSGRPGTTKQVEISRTGFMPGEREGIKTAVKQLLILAGTSQGRREIVNQLNDLTGSADNGDNPEKSTAVIKIWEKSSTDQGGRSLSWCPKK